MRQDDNNKGDCPALPKPDFQSDWDRDGEGVPVYSAGLVARIQREAFEAGLRSAGTSASVVKAAA